MTTYVDANLLHAYVTGRSFTCIIHLFNKPVMYWFPKLQANVATATYGYEFTVTIISSTKSDGKIAKRWNILSFHRVREAIAHSIIRPFHIDGRNNPAVVLSKHTSSSV